MFQVSEQLVVFSLFHIMQSSFLLMQVSLALSRVSVTKLSHMAPHIVRPFLGEQHLPVDMHQSSWVISRLRCADLGYFNLSAIIIAILNPPFRLSRPYSAVKPCIRTSNVLFILHEVLTIPLQGSVKSSAIRLLPWTSRSNSAQTQGPCIQAGKQHTEPCLLHLSH